MAFNCTHSMDQLTKEGAINCTTEYFLDRHSVVVVVAQAESETKSYWPEVTNWQCCCCSILTVYKKIYTHCPRRRQQRRATLGDTTQRLRWTTCNWYLHYVLHCPRIWSWLGALNSAGYLIGLLLYNWTTASSDMLTWGRKYSQSQRQTLWVIGAQPSPGNGWIIFLFLILYIIRNWFLNVLLVLLGIWASKICGGGQGHRAKI